MTNLAGNYWEQRFTEAAVNHSGQNDEISKDFFKNINQNFDDLFKLSSSIIEVGCGTGELTRMIADKYGKKIIGTDLSKHGIDFANRNYANDLASYKVIDILVDEINDLYDMAISSNTLEHFKDPFVVIDKVLSICKAFIILVPYDQPLTDGFDYEGGAGHVFRFTEKSFDKYKVIDWFLFKTNGWQHSSAGEDPRQLAIVISNT